MGRCVKDGRSRYTYARIPVGTAIGELQGLAAREYDEVGQKDLDHLNIDWKRYCELDAAGKLATFIAKRDGVIVGYGCNTKTQTEFRGGESSYGRSTRAWRDRNQHDRWGALHQEVCRWC